VINLRNTVIAAFGLTLLIAAVVLSTTRSGHASGGPVVVQVTGPTDAVADGDKQPVQSQTLLFDLGSDPIQTTFQVPAGKRLCIDYILAAPEEAGDGLSLTVTTAAGGTVVPFPVLAQYSGIASVGSSVKIYADPGTQVQFGLSHTGTVGLLNVAWTGHYIDVP
jgi:hypothetical protein